MEALCAGMEYVKKCFKMKIFLAPKCNCYLFIFAMTWSVPTSPIGEIWKMAYNQAQLTAIPLGPLPKLQSNAEDILQHIFAFYSNHHVLLPEGSSDCKAIINNILNIRWPHIHIYIYCLNLVPVAYVKWNSFTMSNREKCVQTTKSKRFKLLILNCIFLPCSRVSTSWISFSLHIIMELRFFLGQW